MNLENYLQKETAPALADVPFAVCYTSPLKRAAETARLVLGDREVPIVPDKRIQEMSFGEFEGLCCREEGWNIPDPGFRNFFNAPEVYQPPKGGESFEEVRARLNNFLEELYQKEDLQDKMITFIHTWCSTLRDSEPDERSADFRVLAAGGT